MADQHLKGRETELLTIAGAQRSKLFLLCGDRFEASRAFREGEFSAHIFQLSAGARKAVAMATCMVGDHQWMLAKDSMALRVGDGTFVFVLPGVLYGLSVPREISQNLLRQLEEILVTYSAYHDLVASEGLDSIYPKPESEIWSLVYEKLENLAARSCIKIAASIAPAAETAASSSGANDVGAIKIQRAVRMSAAVKLTSHALVSGALVPDNHIQVELTPPPAAALPSVWVLTGLLDAIESCGGRIAVSGASRRRANGLWWLTMEGVELLLEMVRAYNGVAARKRPMVEVAPSEMGGEDAGPSRSSAFGARKRWCGGGGGKAEGLEQKLETCG